MHRGFMMTLKVLLLVLITSSLMVFSSLADERTEYIHSNAGAIALAISDEGILGNGFISPGEPSCQYPRYSGVEHLFFGGLWVGAQMADGSYRVSTSAEDAPTLNHLQEIREFRRAPSEYPDYLDAFVVMSNLVNNENYHPDALAPFHLKSIIDDYQVLESGNHQPLGIQVELQALAWSAGIQDDFVILNYNIINVSGQELRDLYVGYFNDTTVGNVNVNSPWDPYHPWNYYDDLNGAWRPGDPLSDPHIWMMQEHDADGDDGMATSWIGCRLLGTSIPPEPEVGLPPVSYNAWSYHHVPVEDDWYIEPDDPDTFLPGKYQLMGNGHFDVGITPEENFTIPGNRLALLSTGPFTTLAPGDTLNVAFAVVCGEGMEHLLFNSLIAQRMFDSGYNYYPTPAGETPTLKSRLSPNVPNPFNPSTRLAFTLAQTGHTQVSVHDLQGRRLAILVDQALPAGGHSVIWDGRDDAGKKLGSGVYLVRLENAGNIDMQKIVLVK